MRYPGGNSDDAMSVARQVLQLRAQVLGEDHPDSLTSGYNLALQLAENGYETQAIELLELVVESRRRVLGEHHPDTLNALSALAAEHLSVGEFDRSYEICTSVISIRNEYATGSESDKFHDMLTLGLALLGLERFESALAQLDSCRSMHGLTQNEQHRAQLWTGYCLCRMERFDEALRTLRPFESVWTLNADMTPRSVVQIQGAWAWAEHQVGDRAAAKRLWAEAAEIADEYLGPGHQLSLLVLSHFANSTGESGDAEGAVALHRELIARLKEHGDPSGLHRNQLKSLAIDLQASGDQDAALAAWRDYESFVQADG
jgi:tetratricopeptide (TPR) repeat protein